LGCLEAAALASGTLAGLMRMPSVRDRIIRCCNGRSPSQ